MCKASLFEFLTLYRPNARLDEQDEPGAGIS
jgi:hypothetical protein